MNNPKQLQSKNKKNGDEEVMQGAQIGPQGSQNLQSSEQENQKTSQFMNKKNYDILESFPVVFEGTQLRPSESKEQQIEATKKVSVQNEILQSYDITQTIPIKSPQPASDLRFKANTQKPLQGRQVLNNNFIQFNEELAEEQKSGSNFDPDLLTLTNQKQSSNKQSEVRCFQLREVENLKLNRSKLKISEVVLICEGKNQVQVGKGNQNEIIITDGMRSISDKHAIFNWNIYENHWTLTDQSTNGSYLIVDDYDIKVDDVYILGVHLCRIKSIQKSIPIKVVLELELAVEEEQNKFLININVNVGQKAMIGKAHQKELKNDPCIEDDHCYLYFKSKQIKIANCQPVTYKVAKKLEQNNPVRILEGSEIRFGFLNQYIFLPFIKKINISTKTVDGSFQQKEKQLQCIFCKENQTSLYKLEPCNHMDLCVTCASKQACPICGVLIKDFK